MKPGQKSTAIKCVYMYIEEKENKAPHSADNASLIFGGSNKSFENWIRVLDKFSTISGRINLLNAKKFFA